MAVPVAGTLTRIGLYASENISQHDSYTGFICYDANGDEVTYSDPPSTGGIDDAYPFHWYTTGTQVDVVKIEYNGTTYLCNCPGNGSSYKLYLDQLTPEPIASISPAIYFGEVLVGKVNDTPSQPVVTNYIKLSGTVSSSSGSTGTITEIGSDYDYSDLTNNPPVIYNVNGDEVTYTSIYLDSQSRLILTNPNSLGGNFYLRISPYTSPTDYFIWFSGSND